MKKHILLAVAGTVLFILGFLSGAVWMSSKFIHTFNANLPSKEDTSFTSTSRDGDELWAYLYLGGSFTSEEKLVPLPEGAGKMQIRLTHEDKPAAGVKCKLSLNGKFKSPWLATDENGILTFSLTQGKWQLNSMQCNSWKNKPAGEYMLILPGQRKLGRGQSEIISDLQGTGKQVEVTAKTPEAPHMSIVLNKRVEVVWPERSSPKQEATVKKSAISWKPVPRATAYTVKVHRVTRKDRSTTFMPIVERTVTGATNFTLAGLTHARDATAKEEYAVTIEAYAENGDLLSESQSFDGTFVLTDGNVLTEQLPGMTGADGQDEIQGIYRDKKILDSAEVLIREKMFDETAVVLKKVMVKELEGRKLLLTGYLAASKGDCAKANASFDAALKKGEDCVPDEYRGKCK